MRDRLIELIDRADEECKHTKNCESCSGYGKGAQCMNHHIADHLLANGVIVPPCKVGDTVYYIGGIHNSLVKSAIVEEIIMNSNGVSDLLVISENNVVFENSIKIFYFTKEEAERALKGENPKHTSVSLIDGHIDPC